MDFEGIKDIIKAMDNSTLDYLAVNWQGVSIIMKKTGEPDFETPRKPKISEEKSVTSERMVSEPELKAGESVLEEDLHIVKSPIVGTFYDSPGPKKDKFVKVGSEVKKGDVLCILEAMKLMNEIKSDVDGEIVEALVNNQEMVEYNQPMFKIRVK